MENILNSRKVSRMTISGTRALLIWLYEDIRKNFKSTTEQEARKDNSAPSRLYR